MLKKGAEHGMSGARGAMTGRRHDGHGMDGAQAG